MFMQPNTEALANDCDYPVMKTALVGLGWGTPEEV
jgi:hypothetical protein